jgi:hypothetical protein
MRAVYSQVGKLIDERFAGTQRDCIVYILGVQDAAHSLGAKCEITGVGAEVNYDQDNPRLEIASHGNPYLTLFIADSEQCG